jgi:hypothetical protein
MLVLILGATPEVWVAKEGVEDEAPCSVDAFAAALRAQRPDVVVHPWGPNETPPPREGAVRVRLSRRGSDVVLEVTGAGGPVVRTLPAADGCGRNVETAALIVDGALDELRRSRDAPRVGSVAPPPPAPPAPPAERLHLTASVGAGAEQGMFAFVPTFDAEVAARFRFLQVALLVDVALASSSTGFTLTGPEATATTPGGTLSAATSSVGLGAGLAPHLGPGHLVIEATAGVDITSNSTTGSAPLFQRQSGAPKTAFGGIRLGYDLDLPFGLVVSVRAEERLAQQASFEVAGGQFQEAGGGSAVTTPLLSFQALGLLGYHFF